MRGDHGAAALHSSLVCQRAECALCLHAEHELMHPKGSALGLQEDSLALKDI